VEHTAAQIAAAKRAAIAKEKRKTALATTVNVKRKLAIAKRAHRNN
jgi:hypothetical protein